MLTLPALAKSIQRKDFQRLLTGLIGSGLPVPATLEPRLANNRTALLALTLRRATELAYGSAPLLRDLVDNLLVQQRPDGGFGGTPDRLSDPLTTAAAHAALTRLGDLVDPGDAAAVRTAAERSGRWLRDAADLKRLGDVVDPSDRTAAATCLLAAFLIEDDPALAAALITPSVAASLEHAASADRDLIGLWQIVKIGLPDATDHETPKRMDRSFPILS